MRKLYFFLTLVLLFSAQGYSQLLLNDDFTGLTVGANLAGLSSWTKGGTGPDATIQNSGPLTYAGYNGGGAEYVQMPAPIATSSRVYKGFTSTAPGTNTFYYSVLLNLSSATATGDYFLSLGDPTTGTTYFARLFAKSSGAGFNIGVSKLANTATAAYGTTVYNFNQTYVVVVRYSFVTGTTNDEVYVWVNPVLTAEPTTGSADASLAGGIADATPTNIGNFHWHNRSANNPVGKFDAVRVAFGATSADAWTNLNASAPAGPAISPSPSSLSGFSYIQGSGPSTSQNFTITASNLTPAAGNITVTAPTDYEVSSDNTTFSNSINVAYSGGSLASTTVYVRLKAGLSAGTYNGQTVSLSGGGANASVTINGTVTAGSPTVSAAPSSLTGFTTPQGTPSASQSFTVNGSNLTADVVVTAPADYEVSLSAASGYGTSVTITQSGATIPSTTVYVRIRASAPVGSPAGNITVTSTGATTQNVAVSGTVTTSPSTSVTPATLTGFTSTQGAPSTSQSFTVEGSNLTNDIIVTAPLNFEVSLNNTTFSSSVTLTPTAGSVATTTVYIRLKANAIVGSPSGNATVATTGTTAKNVAASGTVNAGTVVAFTRGNLAVVRVGTGSGTLVNTGNPVFIDEYSPSGVLVQSIPLPTTVSGSNSPLILSGTSTSEGLLSRSANDAFISLAGYGTTVGGSSLSGTDAATVPRSVAIIDANGTVNTSTALTDFASTSSPRSAVTSNGTDIWVTGGNGGVRYATTGSTTSTGLTTLANLRQVGIFGGQLYATTNSGTGGNTVPLGAVGTGLPTTAGQTLNALTGLPTLTGTNYYSFQFADLDAATPGVDVLYIADEGGSILKYSLVGSTWTANGSVAAASVRGLALRINAGAVGIFGTTGSSAATGGGSLYFFSDNTGYNGTITGTAITIATASFNTAFRGIALVPGGAITLPVRFSALRASQKANGIELNWANATEENVINYTIERSSDGRNFTAAGKVNAKANNGGKVDYSFLDASPLSGDNFYRIKAVETNGKVVISNIVRINTTKKGIDLVIYPNPVKGADFTVQFSNLPAGKYIVKIYSVQGQEVDSRQMNHTGGNVSQSFTVRNLKPGLYTLQINGAATLQKAFITE